MNFEQNFSPLDPSSEEYQSIGDEYLQMAPGVSGEGEKRKEEKPITLKELGQYKSPKAPKEITLKGLDVSKIEEQLIADAKQSQLAIEETYNNAVKGGTSYLNGFIEKIKQEKPEIQPIISEFLREQASLNKPEQLSQRVEKSYDFLSNFTDINENDRTRDAWINSQYAGAYYSKSNVVKEEYEASSLKDKLSQKQFSGLRSLSYGKKADFNDYINTLQDPDSSQAEKDLVLAKLDKVASNIDIAAGAAMGKEGNTNGIELFNSGTFGAKEATNKMIQIEYDNPFTIQSFKDIVGRATERGLYSAEGADILTVTSENTGIPVERLAEVNRLQQEARQSKAYEEFQKNMSFETFMKNPIGIMAELTLESLVAMYKHGASRMVAGAAEGAALGSVIPGFGTITGASTGFIAGSGLTSLNLEHSSKIMETLSEEGVDITNANSLREAFANEELMDRARTAGWKKGVPVALFDMLSAGIAGKFVSKSAKAIMTTGAPSIGRKVAGGFAELGVQSTLGGAGDAFGQLVEKGKIYDTNAIVMEMLGETFGSAGEIVTGRAFEIAKRNEPLKTKDLVDIVSRNDIGFINNNIDVHLGAGILTEEQANAMKSQVAYAKGMMNKLPAGMSIDGSANIIDLIGQRNQIISNAETLDDAFKKKANAEAKQIDEQILNIFNSEENAIKESTRKEQISTEQGGISQYQGTQPVQEQATNEAKDSNRPISGQAQFQVGQQDVGVYKKETSAITNKMNDIGGAAVEFTADASVNATSKANVGTLSQREGVVKSPNVLSITDFNGIPMMLTISDELTTGSIVNPETGNTIDNLNGGIGFNYSEGNTEFAWAYTDEKTAVDTLNSAKNIYQANKELFDKLWAEGKLPQNHIPVAVVKMGVDAITSNEAVFRVLADNVSSLPKANQKAAYTALVADIKNRLDITQKTVDENTKAGRAISPSLNNTLNGYKTIYNEYLKSNKDIASVINNIGTLNINTRPLITDRVTIGEVGLLPAKPKVTKSTVPVVKALLNTLPKESAKKLHLGYITEPLRDESIKNVPARHVIGFVGIDVSKDAPVQTSTHKNYPYALSGQGLGVVENTAHIASVMPTAYGNVVSKITDAVAKEGSITPSEAVSRALPSGLANAIFKNKTLATNDNLSKLIGFLNLSFPDVTFFTDKQSFEDVLSSEGVKEYLKDGDVIYGVTKDGNIYLNPEKATYNTAIHEMGHIWVDFIENTNPTLFAQGLKLVEGTPEFESAKARLGDNVFARKEALAMLIGNKGETIADAAMQSQFKEWLVGVWKYLQEIFPNLRKLTPEQVQNLSLQDFLGGALQDILSGKPISTQRAEYTATQSQFQIGEKPSWFDDTPGSQKIKVNDDFINNNPEFLDVVKHNLFLINKNQKGFKGDVKSLNSAIDERINEKNLEINAQQVRDYIARMYKATPKDKANISKTISRIEATERMYSLFTDKAIETNKEDIRKRIIDNDEYNDAEKEIILGMIDDIIPENVFLFINEASPDAKKNKENYYSFSTNLLKSKKPSAFIHEVGHWGFYNILTPEERIEFFKYSAERFAKGKNKLEDEQAFGRQFQATREEDGKIITGLYSTNATENFMEYFAEQFRQYYIENKIDDAKFNTLFQKISLVLDKILDLFRKASYNKELVKYFDKIIDARPKETAPIQEAQQETGIVKAEPEQPSTEVGIVPPTGEVGMPEEQQPSGLPQKKKYDWEKGTKEKPQIGETMVKTSTGRYVGVETMKAQLTERQKTLREMAKGAKSFFKDVSILIKTVLIDNQSGILSALSNIGRQGQLVKAYLLTRNGASSTAVILAEDGVKRVYGNVTRRKVFNINGAKINEYQLLNQMIAFRRVISIQQRMEDAYANMYSEWLKIKPLYESINNTKNSIKKLSEIIASDDFKILNKEQKIAVKNRLNGLKAELELLSETFDKESVDFNKSKKVLLDNNMIDEKTNNITEKLEIEFAMGQLTASQAKASLYEVREAIGEEAFDKLMNNSDEYSKHFNEMLKSRMEAGLISKEVYEDLSKYYYAPTKYIEQFLTSAMLSVASRSTSYVKDATLLKKLAGGSESLNNNDYEGLLRAVTYASEHSIAENRATARFYDLVASNIDNFEKNGIRLGTILVPIEASSDARFDIIDQKLNAITSEGEQGKLQYKGISKAETGIQKAGIMEMAPYQEPIDVIIGDDGKKYRIVQQPLKKYEDYIKTYSNGRRLDIIVPQGFADEWYNRNMVSNKYYNMGLSIAGKVTGANLLRIIATGVNPIFGIVQLIPDTTSAYAATIEQRRSVTGLFLIEYPMFFAKTLIASNDIFRNTEDYKEALKYGALTNFYNGGSISFEKGITGEDSRSIENVIAVWQDKSPVVARESLAALKYLMIGTKKITETTEQLTKIALYKEVRDNKLKKFEKENSRKPDAQELEDIRIESAAIARSTADFHRKGVIGSGMNKVFPYLNAGVQIDRASTNSALKTPWKFAYNALSFIGVASLLTAYSLGAFDDDDEELVRKKREAYFRLSEKDRDTRVIMEYIDSEDRFISVKIPSFLVPMQSLSRRATEKYYLNNKTLNENDLIEITKQVIEATPIGQYKTLSSRNPGYSMFQKYFENYDSYRKEQVVQNEKGIYDYEEGTKAGTRRASAISQKIGQLTKDGIPGFPEGISPKRLDAVANTIPFSSNPFTSIPLFFVEKGTASKELFEERYGKTAMSNIMKISGVTDRFMKAGSKINQGIIDIPEEKAKERTSTTYKFADIIINKYDSLLKQNDTAEKKLTKPAIFDKVKREFLKEEYKQLSPQDKIIAKNYIQSEFKSIVIKGKVDPNILQIINISSPAAKLESILESIRTIHTTEESKKAFIKDLYDAGIARSKSFLKELNMSGKKILNNGSKNKYYNEEAGFVDNEIKKLIKKDR
jgi:hypothetical protein